MANNKSTKPTTAESWGELYKKEYPKYEEFNNKLKTLMSTLLKEHNLEVANIEARPKKVRDFVEKIQREEKDYSNPLKEITDLVGVRIIAYYKEDVDKIGEIIKKEFDIDKENSIDKAQTLDPDRFGYLSIHYVVSLSLPRRGLTEWKAFEDIKAEIQVRTVLQHAWAEIDHKLRYKAKEEVPKNLRRKLFRLSALLELADEQFSDLRKAEEEVQKHYLQKVKRKKLDMEIDLYSLEIYLKLTELTQNKLVQIAEQAGFRHFETKKLREPMAKDMPKIITRILHTSLKLLGIVRIEELEEILKKEAPKWGREVLTRLCKISSAKGLTPFATPILVDIFFIVYARRKFLDEEVLKKLPFRKELIEAIIEVVTTE